MNIKVFKIIEKTNVEGPGNRFCIWVQGCSRNCKGCWAQDTHSSAQGEWVSADELFSKIISTEGIEGVTFLGGEPFEQAQALALLAQKIKEANLSLVTFSGFLIEELQKMNDKNVNDLLECTDLLIDGPFIEERFDLKRPWVGSKNQRYIFLSDRYSQKDLENVKNKIEVRINENGVIFANGMGDFAKIEETLCLK